MTNTGHCVLRRYIYPTFLLIYVSPTLELFFPLSWLIYFPVTDPRRGEESWSSRPLNSRISFCERHSKPDGNLTWNIFFVKQSRLSMNIFTCFCPFNISSKYKTLESHSSWLFTRVNHYLRSKHAFRRNFRFLTRILLR